jgi:hypothetical protein
MERILQAISGTLQTCCEQFGLFFAVKRSNMHIILIAAAVFLVLCYFAKKTERDRMLLSFLLVFSILYTFPPTAYIIIKCIGDIVYWRMFWLIPIPVVIAYAVVKGTGLIRPALIREITFAGLCVMIAFFGMYLFSEENIDMNSNVYGVPNTVVQICDAVNEDAKEQNLSDFTVAPDKRYASWIRVYDPSIHTLYGRGGNGSVMHDNDPVAVRIFKTISSRYPDWLSLREDLEEEQCAYVVAKPSILNAHQAELFGFRVVQETQHYIILYNSFGE